MTGRQDASVLTERQLAVVGLVSLGLSNKEIAARLGVSVRAIEATLTRVYERLDVANRSALIALALSEAGFGLAVARRSVASGLGAVATPRSLEEEAAAYANAPFMVALTQGPEHHYSFVNRVAAEVAGRPVAGLVGRSVMVVYPDLDPAFRAALDGSYASGRPWSSGIPAHVRWTHADGTVRESTVDLIFQPVRDATGAVVGILHIGIEGSAPD